MADVITRFKLETTQYDSKLRDAAKGLSDYARVAAFAGNEFDKFTKDQAEAARALGSISTSANNAKDKVRELVNAYNQAANAYNALTKEQQQSDWGKALAESINTLKGRITEAKQELYSMGDSAKNSGGIMDVLAQKFTVNIDALKLFNVGLSAAKAALDVAKDAFFSSEANVDEWGRTMASAEALYSGFVTALNTSDFSSFLTQIDGIVQAAREAYDELDKLGTMRTIQAPGFAKQEAENQRLRLMIMTGKFIEAGDGRKSPLGLKNGDILSPEQIRTLERQLQNGMNKIVSLTKNELGQTGKAIDAYYDSLAKQNGMSIQEFRQGTSSWDAYQEKMRGYEQYQKWRRENTFTDAWGNRQVREGNPYQEFKKWGVFRVDKMGTNSYNDLVGLIKQQQQQQQQMYSTLGQTYRTINRAEGFTVRDLLNGGGGGSTNTEVVAISGSIDEQTKKVQELQKAWRAAADDNSRQKIKAELDEQQYVLDRMTGKEKFDPSKIQQITDLSGRTPLATPEQLTKGAGLTLPVSLTADVEKLKSELQVELNAQNVKVDETTLKTLLKDSIQNGINGMDLQFASLSDQIAKGIDVPEEKWQKILDDYNKLREAIGETPIEIDFKSGELKDSGLSKKEGGDHFEDTSKLVSGLNSGASGLQQMGVKLPENVQKTMSVIQGIMSVIQGTNAIITLIHSVSTPSKIASETANTAAETANTVAIGALTAAVAANTTALTVNTATGFIPFFAHGGLVHAATGYMVPGNDHADRTLIAASSGELILNRAQQGVIASQLESGNGGGMRVVGEIQGEKIVLVANRFLKRSGQGELVTWK